MVERKWTKKSVRSTTSHQNMSSNSAFCHVKRRGGRLSNGFLQSSLFFAITQEFLVIFEQLETRTRSSIQESAEDRGKGYGEIRRI